jgi:hypothetical protein
MSINAMTWAFRVEAPISSGERLVLLVLADHYGVDGSPAYPSTDRIAELAHVDRATVFRAVQKLKGLGVIRHVGRRPSGTVIYDLNLDQSHYATPPVESHPATASSRIASPQGSHPATRTGRTGRTGNRDISGGSGRERAREAFNGIVEEIEARGDTARSLVAVWKFDQADPIDLTDERLTVAVDRPRVGHTQEKFEPLVREVAGVGLEVIERRGAA